MSTNEDAVRVTDDMSVMNIGSLITPTFRTTGVNSDVIEKKTTQILNYLRATTTLSIENGINTPNLDGDASADQKYPIIVLINGAGGNGKDTFVEAVGKSCSASNLSTIQEVKDAADVLISVVDNYDLAVGPTVCAGKHKEEKTDQYRSFLHDIKMAWANFCDGPNTCILGHLQDIMAEQLSGNVAYDVIFVHVREPEEIEKLKTAITQKLGLICITILVKGLVDPSVYTNSGDAGVYNYNYDMTIINQLNRKELFELQATLFGERIITANLSYGIICNLIPNPYDSASVSVNVPIDNATTVADTANDTGSISGTGTGFLTGANDIGSVGLG